MRMKELCAEERPREKLLLRGASSLSGAELIAILLGSGTGGRNAVEVAQELLSGVGGRLGALAALSPEAIARQKGIGRTRALSVVAALELGRRYLMEGPDAVPCAYTEPSQVVRLMLPLLKGLDHEECWVLYFNRPHFLIGKDRITSGTLDATLIDAKFILRKVVEKQAAAIILVHNHPSGSPRPGEADCRETERLRKALKVFDIPLLDHIIISDGAWFSFESGCLTPNAPPPSGPA